MNSKQRTMLVLIKWPPRIKVGTSLGHIASFRFQTIFFQEVVAKSVRNVLIKERGPVPHQISTKWSILDF